MKHLARNARRGLGWFIFAGGNLAAMSMLADSLKR